MNNCALITHLIPKILIFILLSFLTVTLQSNTLENDKITNAKTYVFVHGAGGGGWDWKLLDKLLTHRGHNVHRITLTGLGERAHLLSASINLTTHISDVTNTIVFDRLKNIVLVGHSYGGMVISEATQAKPNVKQLIYLSAILLKEGENVNGDEERTRPSKIRIEVDEDLNSIVKKDAIIPAFYEDVAIDITEKYLLKKMKIESIMK